MKQKNDGDAMNCQAIQNQILALPDPRELTPALREHVLGCAGCQTWARKAARLEALLKQLPVPAAPREKKETLIGELMQAEPVIQPMATPAMRPGLGLVAVRFLRRNAAYVGGLAAAVLVAVGLYALWPTRTSTPEMVQTQKYPLLERIVARDVELARADTPSKRLEVLSGMADDLATDTRGMARLASGDELKQMAGWYEKVVKDGMVPQAKNLPLHMPEAEKKKFLDALAAKLETDATEAEKLAREAPQDAQPALKRMAETAREGGKSLRGGK
jgi:hypothetical protein